MSLLEFCEILENHFDFKVIRQSVSARVSVCDLGIEDVMLYMTLENMPGEATITGIKLSIQRHPFKRAGLLRYHACNPHENAAIALRALLNQVKDGKIGGRDHINTFLDGIETLISLYIEHKPDTDK